MFLNVFSCIYQSILKHNAKSKSDFSFHKKAFVVNTKSKYNSYRYDALKRYYLTFNRGVLLGKKEKIIYDNIRIEQGSCALQVTI